MTLILGRGAIMPSIQEKISLLLVDDERDFLEAAAAALSRRGFDVDTANSGEQAVRMVKQKRPDVIVLDVKMPGIDGVQLFHRLSLVYPEIPVILLTGISG